MKVLFLTQQNIGDGKVLNGGDAVTSSNYKALVEVCGKENVTVVKIPEEPKVIKRYFNYMMLRNMYSKSAEKKVISEINAADWDVLFFDGTWFGKISHKIQKKGKIITFLHNVEYQYSLDRLRQNILTCNKFLSVAYNEKSLMKQTDYIFTLNERDKQLVQKHYQREVDMLLPVTFQDTFIETEKQDTVKAKDALPTVLFVGSFFKPNEMGIKWFMKEVMPTANCKLQIVGKGMEKLKDYENDKIEVLGTVKDLSACYHSADAVVMPIFVGGGMKVKTAEALMYGKKIFATKEALTGYDVVGVEGIKECNTAEEFIAAITSIQENEYFCMEVRKLFLEKYEQNTKIKKLTDFLSDL